MQHWRKMAVAPIVRANPHEPLMSRFKMIFSWWNSATWGTLLTTWLSGSPVGTDDFGNRYYQNKDGSRRWVIYNGTVEEFKIAGVDGDRMRHHSGHQSVK